MIGFGTVTGSSLIGVAIACTGNILISLALTVQKLAHRRQNDELVASQTPSDSSDSSKPSSPRHGVSSQVDRRAGGERGERGAGDKPLREQPDVVIPVLLVPACASPGSSASEHDVNSVDQVGAGSADMARRMSLDSVPEEERVDGMAGRLLQAERTANATSAVVVRPQGRSTSPGRVLVPPGYIADLQIDSGAGNGPTQNGTAGHTGISDGKADGESNGRAGETGGSGDDEGHAASGHGRDDHKDNDHKPEVQEGMYLKSKLWWFGLALISIGEGGNFLSYGFAPASVVAPLGTVALIANCIFAPLILKETFHVKELIGMALAIIGAVTVVWSSHGSNPRLDPDSLLHAIKQLPFLIYTLINAVLVSILVLLSRSPRWESRFIGIDVGICALFGGYTVLSTKALSSLLSTMFFDAFEYWITWVLVLVLVVTSVLQVKYLNRALMKFQSKEVIPTQFVFFSLAAIIGSAVLYQEFRDVSFSVFVNFAFGIATTFLGVHLLTTFSSGSDSDSDDESDPSTDPSQAQTSRGPPAAPQRATSSASLNLLLPSTSRLSERTPLLIPVPESARYPATAVIPPSAVGSLKGRLLKRTSTGDFTPTLGLSSQAGFLLMATTPPSAAQGAMRRDRSGSRTWVSPPNAGDEERGVGLGGRDGRDGRDGQSSRSAQAANDRRPQTDEADRGQSERAEGRNT